MFMNLHAVFFLLLNYLLTIDTILFFLSLFLHHLGTIFSSSTIKSTSAFELIHMDIWGQFPPSFIHYHSYFLTIVDDFTRDTWIFLMKSKTEAMLLIVQFITYVYNQCSKHVKQIRSDNDK